MSSTSHGRIPEDFIESVLAKTDIAALIQESVNLKKNGANYSACCPFHQEKTPSFTVSQTKQFYHCFGCGAHGDAIRFLMEYQTLSFVDAVERLAARVGLVVPKDPQAIVKHQQRASTTSVLNKVAEFYCQQLKNHPGAQSAITYLKKRGLTGQVAKKFALGFAPPGWENVLQQFQDDEEAFKKLEETGLIIKHPQGKYYDRFRERIMFPIRDRRGEVIGFGARVMDQSLPKYLNSSDSNIFQKGHCLYGLYEALTAKEKWQQAIVVEGYLDVVALAQFGVVGAVATLGTAITIHHLTQLFQQVNKIVFCFDGDKAGQAAAWKALQLVLPLIQADRQMRFVFLPLGDDPDSYIRQHGLADFQALLKNSTPLSEYFFATLSEQIKPDSMDNRARLANLARTQIETIPAGIFKEMMYEQLASLVGSTPQVMRGEKAYRSFYSKNYTKTKIARATGPVTPAYIASALILRLPLLSLLAQDKTSLWQTLTMPGLELLNQLLQLLVEAPQLSTEKLRELLEQRGMDLKPLADCVDKIAFIPEEGLEAEFSGAISRLVVIGRQQVAEKLLLKAKKTELSDEEKQQLKEFLQTGESIG